MENCGDAIFSAGLALIKWLYFYYTDAAGSRIVINQISEAFQSQADHPPYILEIRIKPVLPL